MFFRKRFFPFFLTQFMGAFNDNVVKNALVTLIVYKTAVEQGFNPTLWITAAAGIFILPFFLFAGTAGKICLVLPNAKLIRQIKFCEILIVLAAGAGFWFENIWILMGVLFMMGAQSTFFGPLKYSVLPMLLKNENELVFGNACFSSGTLLAILIGTIFGTGVIIMDDGVLLTISLILITALIGWSASLAIPYLPVIEKKTVRISKFIIKDTVELIRFINKRSLLLQLVLASSWFWFVGATILSQLPTFFGHVLRVEESVFTLNLALFSIGVGLGSMLSYKINHRNLKPAQGIIMLTLMSIAFFDFYAAFLNLNLPEETRNSLLIFSEYYSHFNSIRMSFDLFLISLFGGYYFLPLITLLETKSPDSERSKVIAAANLYNALFMVLSALIIFLLQLVQLSIPDIFLGLGAINLVAAFIYSKTEIIHVKNLR